MAARLRSRKLCPSDQRSGLRICAFLAFLGCAERRVTPAGSLDAPLRRLSWTGRPMLLAPSEEIVLGASSPQMVAPAADAMASVVSVERVRSAPAWGGKGAR